MAAAPRAAEPERPSDPRIVLPIPPRGVEVTDRLCWGLLAVAMAVAAGLILYLNRGTTFYLDELVHVYGSPTLDARGVIEPVNGHLAITTKLVYKGVLETIGAEYVVFRLLHVAAFLLAAGLFYALARRRIGVFAALAPTIVLLFFGSAFSHVVIPVGLGIFVSVSAALGALLCLERDDRRGDVAACGLMVLSISTFTIGLAFLVGVAISVVLRDDRVRRAWVFLVPLVLYAAWWVWSLSEPGSSEGETELSNVAEIPRWIADSLSVTVAALLGVEYDFPGGSIFGALGWGRVLAALAIVALALRIARGRIPTSLWVSLGILVAYWCLGAFAAEPGVRGPGATRYLYPAAVMVLLVATDAARSVRFSGLGLFALFAIVAFSLSTNVERLQDGGAGLRDYSARARAQFGVLELARGHVAPAFNPAVAAPEASPVGALAGIYFESSDRYGSLGYTPAELERQSEEVRSGADSILARALDVRLRPAREDQARGCEVFRPDGPEGTVAFELPPGGALLRARGPEPAPLAIGRFAVVPSAALLPLAPGEQAALAVPTDAYPRPWRATVAGARSVEVCRLP